MKKSLVVLFTLAVAVLVCTSVRACDSLKISFFKNASSVTVKEQPEQNMSEIAVLPTMNTNSSAPNRIWVGTFQLVWNDAIDSLIKNPIEFEDGFNQTAADLNKREINKEDISEDSYYIKSGIISPELKAEIEKGIKEKFNETSDILDSVDFTYDPMKYLFYAMLKKDFKFIVPFDKLDEAPFASNPALVKYFGVNEDSSSKLYKNVSVLFYNKNNDFAVSIHTKGNDEVILYRTNDDKTFSEYYADLKEKTQDFEGSQFFGADDRLTVPDMKLYQMVSFTDLEGKNIKNTDLRIDKTLETVDFRMNNEGVKLKSEALMAMDQALDIAQHSKTRKFYFNDKFVLFLIERGKTVPYFGMRVCDVEALNKTGKED